MTHNKAMNMNKIIEALRKSQEVETPTNGREPGDTLLLSELDIPFTTQAY